MNVDQIIKEIQALYNDRDYSLEEALDNMQMIEEAASMNADAFLAVIRAQED